MGNDGGSIPRRVELVKEAARKPNTSELKATLLEAQTHAWKICPLSNRPLAPPIVSDCAGVLYNKDAVIEQLIPKKNDRSDIDVLQGRVNSLRDLVEVHFTVVREDEEEKRICFITSKELGPISKAVYLVPCGHVFSEAAIREVKGDRCVQCNEEYTPENIINILPSTSDEKNKLFSRSTMLREAGLSHSLKKLPGGKKRKKAMTVESAVVTNIASEKSIPQSSLGIKNPATASLTSKVLEEQDERNKRRKMNMNENLKSLFTSKNYGSQVHKNDDFMTRGFSLPTKKG